MLAFFLPVQIRSLTTGSVIAVMATAFALAVGLMMFGYRRPRWILLACAAPFVNAVIWFVGYLLAGWVHFFGSGVDSFVCGSVFVLLLFVVLGFIPGCLGLLSSLVVMTRLKK